MMKASIIDIIINKWYNKCNINDWINSAKIVINDIIYAKTNN